ncbi:MAG: LptA/OstA family protein, partial [Candidatus Eremiobacterota bacterium]
MRCKWLLLAVAILWLAQPLEAAPTLRELKVTADRLDYDDAKNRVRLVGNVRLETHNAVMTAPYAEYNTDTQVAELSGGIRLVSPD